MTFSKILTVSAASFMVLGSTAAHASNGSRASLAPNPCVSSMQGCVLPISRPAAVVQPAATTAAPAAVAEEAGFPWLLIALLGAAVLAGILLLGDDDDAPDTTPVST